jgi:hypothetical protein
MKESRRHLLGLTLLRYTISHAVTTTDVLSFPCLSAAEFLESSTTIEDPESTKLEVKYERIDINKSTAQRLKAPSNWF